MIFDAEADGLLDTVTKVHVLAYEDKEGKVQHTHDYGEMREILTSAKLLIGHNIITYDVPMLERILKIKIKARLIDTLALSWYLNHTRIIHGLDSYGTQYGIPKPKITDWEGLSPEEYAHRCIEDVKINLMLWRDLKRKLLNIYNTKKDADRLISYLSFKMDCLREQERSQWKLDKELAQASYDTLFKQREEKVEELRSHMPTVPQFEEKTKPKNCFKKDGSWSVNGAKWFNLLREEGLEEDFDGEVRLHTSDKESNPNSPDQVKSWLYSMGWVPDTFKYAKNKETGDERKIPQVRKKVDDVSVLCHSVVELMDEHPELGVLNGLTVIQHRLSVFQGFLENERGGWLQARAAGFTNTLRFKHRVIVNLPKVDKAWGEEIRGSLVAPEGYILCGSDMVSLEETTKKHYMFPYDPDFVKEMSGEGFDAHLDLARHAGAVSQDQIDAYINKAVGAVCLKLIRGQYKAANYSCVYGVGAPKLAREIKLTIRQAQALIDAYWERNWSVRRIAEDTVVKTIGKEMWLYNPVSRFWYSLRYKKDIFSTLNQGTGVFCFDSWIKVFRKKRPQLTGQFHDEVILCIKKGSEEKCKVLLQESIEEVNDKLKLNVALGVDIQFGNTYAEIH